MAKKTKQNAGAHLSSPTDKVEVCIEVLKLFQLLSTVEQGEVMDILGAAFGYDVMSI